MQRATRARSQAPKTATRSNGAANIPDEETVKGYFKTLSNWGRWGKDDELGTLNFISPAKRLEATALVRDGVSVSCARPITTERAPDVISPFLHYMTGTGERLALQASQPGGAQGGGGSGDFYGIAYHGYFITHLDAPCHIFWNGKMYNDRSPSLVTPQGAKACSIEPVHDGVVTRGVLLDIPRLRNVKWLEPGDHIYPEDLEAAERACDVRAKEGDALLIRTGHWKRRTELGAWPLAQGNAGLHGSCLPWLHQRRVAMLGSDTVQDSIPSGYPAMRQPIHQIGIPAMGLWLMDNGNFEDLAAGCERRNRWVFMFVLSPLRVVNGTGSPANPLAIF